jgi:hypothetical protein
MYVRTHSSVASSNAVKSDEPDAPPVKSARCVRQKFP